MYKLIALDIDGTVLNSRNQVAAETRQAVQAAIARGVRVTLATGRGFPSAQGIARLLGLHGTPLVTHDGAYVADPLTGQVLSETRVPAEMAREACAVMQGAGLKINVVHEQFLLSNQRIRNFTWRWLRPRHWASAANIFREARDYPHVYARDLERYMRANPVAPPKFYAMGTPDQLQAGAALLAERFSGALVTTPAGSYAMEVTPAGVSKATGLRVLAGALGIRPEEVVGIGDNYNDVEMLTQVGLGVAMGNAPEDVRKLARVVTRTNDEHGVAYAIEHWVLSAM